MTAGFFPFSVMGICCRNIMIAEPFLKGGEPMPHPLPPLTAIAKVDASSHRAFNSSAALAERSARRQKSENRFLTSSYHRRISRTLPGHPFFYAFFHSVSNAY